LFGERFQSSRGLAQSKDSKAAWRFDGRAGVWTAVVLYRFSIGARRNRLLLGAGAVLSPQPRHFFI
jgi:hypothetical protein